MYKFIYRVTEIRNILNHLWLIEAILDVSIILLAGFLIIMYIGISPYWMIIPVLIYLIAAFRNRSKKDTVALIEKKYPSLNERLRTIYDNRENENLIVENLAESVLLDVEKIKYSSFFDSRKLGIRIAIILLLITFLISMSSFNPMHFEKKKDLAAISSKSLNKITSESTSPDTNIFGEPQFIDISNDSQGLIVYRGQGSELNIPGKEKKSPEFPPIFPHDEDFAASASSPYSEAIPPVYQYIVKNYFTNISRE